MGYHLNFGLIWRNFDQAAGACSSASSWRVISIVIGASSGWRSRSLYVSAGRVVRTLDLGSMSSSSATCRCCCWSTSSSTACRRSATFATARRHRSLRRCRSMPAPTSSRSSAPGSTRCRAGLIDAGKAIGLTPWQRLIYVRLPTMFAHHAAGALQHLHLAVQGHLGRLGHRGAGADLRRAVDQLQHLPHRRGLCGVTAMYLVAGYAILFGLRLLERRFRVEREMAKMIDAIIYAIPFL